MLVVTENPAAAIRAAFEHGGDSAAVELGRLFPGIADNAQARTHARTIAGWTSTPDGAPRQVEQMGSTKGPVIL